VARQTSFGAASEGPPPAARGAGPSAGDRTLSQRPARLASWTWEPSCGSAVWSPEMYALLGVAPAGGPVADARFLSLVHPDDRGAVAAAYEQAVRHGQPLEMDFRVLSSAGGERVLHALGCRDHERPDRYVGTLQDVTRERLAERRLAETEVRLRAIVESAPIGVLVRDLDGRIREANAAAAAALLRTPDALIGRTIAELCPERAARAIDQADRRVLQTGRQASVEIEPGRDGRTYELIVYPVPGPAGATAAIGAHVLDVTGRVARERDLQRSRAYHQTIVAAMGEGYCLTIDGSITAVNDSLCELTGFTRDQLIGSRAPFPFLPADEGDRAAHERRSLIDRGGGTLELVLARADGTRFEAEITTRPARNADGTVLGLVSTFRDVSARRRYERELERLATTDPLTGLANHRTFHERLRAEVARARRHNRRLSLALLDLDHFKDVNDRHGHQSGDGALREVARRLAGVAREGELVARVGGEEFAWLLPDCDAQGALAAAERARLAVRSTPVQPAGTLTISVGVCDLEHAAGATELYGRADEALYLAKRAGRDRSLPHPAALPGRRA